MSPRTTPTLDGRTSDQIVTQFATLAKSYVPEWNFTPADPDTGGVLAMVFANQMQQTIGRYNTVFERYHQEFVNMLGINLLPATPASGVVTMELLSSTVEGAHVPRGTKMISKETDIQGRALVFESVEDLYVTNANLSDVLEISQKHGRIRFHQGDLQRGNLIPDMEVPDLIPEAENYELFHFDANGVEENGLLICHSCICGDKDQTVALRFHGPQQQKIVRMLADESRFTIYRYNGELEPVDDVTVVDDALHFTAGGCTTVTMDDEEFGLIYIQAKSPIIESIYVTAVTMAVEGSKIVPEFLGSSEQSFVEEKVSVFGNQLDLYDEFYIGSESAFAKSGADIEVTFNLSFRERELGTSTDDIGFELKPIRKKPKNVIQSQQYKSCVNEVEIAY
ncbi:MAG: hypothetical protein R3Y62_07505, partial [Eubacteriales bacterium]